MPNWMTQLPGAEYQGEDPDGFTIRDDVIACFEEYIERFELPIRYEYQVTSVEPIEAGYLVGTNKAEFEDSTIQRQPAIGDPPTSFQRISKSRGTARWCGACRRVGTIRLPDCRRALSKWTQGLSLRGQRRSAPSSLPWQRRYVVVR